MSHKEQQCTSAVGLEVEFSVKEESPELPWGRRAGIDQLH